MTTVRRFRKNPNLIVVIVPGHGRVHDVDILEGEQYAHLAPHLLREIGVPLEQAVYSSVPAAAAVPALHDALAIAARETVPVEGNAPATTDPAPPPKHMTMEDAILEQQMSTPNDLVVFLPTEPVAPPTDPAVLATTIPESNSANVAPNDTLTSEDPPAPVKNKGGRPRKVKPAPDA